MILLFVVFSAQVAMAANVEGLGNGRCIATHFLYQDAFCLVHIDISSHGILEAFLRYCLLHFFLYDIVHDVFHIAFLQCAKRFTHHIFDFAIPLYGAIIGILVQAAASAIAFSYNLFTVHFYYF